jgi:hypothetical protein
MMTYELDDTEKEALLNTVITRARADLNDGRPLTEMRAGATEECTCHKFIRLHDGTCDVHGRVRKAPAMTEEAQELQRDASALSYTAIRFSGLYKELSGDEWEALADKYGKQIVAILEAACDEELTRREAGESTD